MLTAGDARAEVDLLRGGRLASLQVGGVELLVTEPRDHMMLWGSFPMAPFAGRLRRGVLAWEGRTWDLPVNLPPHAIHGTTFDRPWDLEADGSFVCPFGERWPFGGHARQRVDLTPERLTCTLEVHADDRPFPASAGFHPWFRLPVELDLTPFEGALLHARDADGMPSGELVPAPSPPWDDCFTRLDGPPVLRFPEGITLTLTSDARHWVVYTPPHAVCVEPQTGPPDELNTDPHVVEPGRALSVTMTLTWG